MTGPLRGVRIVEMAGLGPGPFAAMLLADMGAEVIRIHQKDGTPLLPFMNGPCDVLARGRRAMAIDLKKPGAADAVLQLIERADALIEGFRPGVMERLGLGPEVCLARNPKLVFGRMTGWGQTGKLAQSAGHDINYLAISGLLNAVGRPGMPPPPPPGGTVGDFGSGAMFLAFGIVCALLEARQSGQGQVVDAAITDGAAVLSAAMMGLKAAGAWSNRRGENLGDGGAHCFDTYECADGKCISVGPLEPQFHRCMLQKLGIDDPAFDKHMDPRKWPDLKRRLAEVFRTRMRDEWTAVFDGSDACVFPVLDWDEAPRHEHNRDRNTFIEIAGVTQPAPAPRFSRTIPEVSRPPARPDEHTDAIFSDWGVAPDIVARLRQQGAI